MERAPGGDKSPFTAPAAIQFGSVRGIQAGASAVTKAAMAYVAVRHSSAHSRGIMADAARSWRPGFLANHPEWYHHVENSGKEPVSISIEGIALQI